MFVSAHAWHDVTSTMCKHPPLLPNNAAPDLTMLQGILVYAGCHMWKHHFDPSLSVPDEASIRHNATVLHCTFTTFPLEANNAPMCAQLVTPHLVSMPGWMPLADLNPGHLDSLRGPLLQALERGHHLQARRTLCLPRPSGDSTTLM